MVTRAVKRGKEARIHRARIRVSRGRKDRMRRAASAFSGRSPDSKYGAKRRSICLSHFVRRSVPARHIRILESIV